MASISSWMPQSHPLAVGSWRWGKRERERDRQTDRQTERQTNRKTERQNERKKDKQTEGRKPSLGVLRT